MKPMVGTTTMESPKLKATLSILPKASFLGKSATTNVYPGKNKIKGDPKTICRALDEKKVAVIISGIARIFMIRSSF
jgi:hypothetical protein